MDAETAYNWASITKTLTAIAILQLRDRGQLSLDDPAVRYVPELRQVHDAFGPVDDITIRHLLTHSAGFRNPTWPWDCDDAKDCDWQPFEPTKWAQVAAMLPYTHVAFKPGSRWSYSNLGYVFLGQIIERLSGDDFEVYIDKNILKPLGMTASYFDRAPVFSGGPRVGKLSARGREAHAAAVQLRYRHHDLEQRIESADPGHGEVSALPDRRAGESALRGRAETQFARRGVDGRAAATEPGEAPTPYTAGPHGAQPMMGLGFFVLEAAGTATSTTMATRADSLPNC